MRRSGEAPRSPRPRGAPSQRVCQAWERSRSALYARPRERGARAAGSDAHGVGRDAAGGDSGRSRPLAVPGRGPGARLRILDGIRVARTRVLVLSPAAARAPMPGDRHAGAERDVGHRRRAGPRWTTGGAGSSQRSWNAECVGWHVCKVGSRFAALEPIAQGLRRIYGALDADSARGLALRMDHGSQYLSDHFLNQIRYWGMRPSYGFVEEPERTAWRSGGIARSRSKRPTGASSRTSRRYARSDRAVQHAWRLEKLGYHTPTRPARRTSYAGRRTLTCVQRTGCGTRLASRALLTVSKESRRGAHPEPVQIARIRYA